MPTLVIGNKNYSSWSLRPWLALRQAGVAFDEKVIALGQPETRAEILKYSPSGRVPCLIDGELTVWDSLAICEYLAERHPGLWPADAAARAQARCVSAEMHAGFAALRSQMPMNCRRLGAARPRSPEVDADLARIAAIWSDCRARYGAAGAFLFGAFSIADAMYAPVVWRLRSYGVGFEGAAGGYAGHLLDLPAMREWLAAACAETASIPDYE